MTTAPADVGPEMRMVASVRALKASKRIGTEQIRSHIGVSRSTWFERMRTGQFTVGEAIALADLFGVTVQSMIDGELSLPKVRSLVALRGGLPPSQSSQIGTQSPLVNSVLTPV